MKIAISLITHNDMELLVPCLNSLFASDLNQHEYKVFCYDNGSNIVYKEYLANLNVLKYTMWSSTNEGIVVPRIKIYEEIIKENFDFLFEIHSDMLFPSVWLKPLLEIDDDNTIILQPHIFQPPPTISIEALEKHLHKLIYDKTYSKCRQVHPWLIKLNYLNKIGGYYDAIFSPQQFEDDDLTYRVVKNGFNVKSTGKSWVCHYGGVTRNKVLPSYNDVHLKLFEKKHQVSFSDAIKLFEYHPVRFNSM